MRVLLSIKPEYVEKIFRGQKKYEYRKKIFKRNDVDTIVIYATKPVGKVVGEFKIREILEDEPPILWEKTKQHSGINKESFRSYFSGIEKGFAISIEDITVYQEPLELNQFNPSIRCAPQSFMYI